MSTVEYKGYKVWYEESGAGEPLLFLHNGGNDHRIWDHQVKHFSRTHRVIVVDHLGHGNSDRSPFDYTLPLFTGEVAALVEQLSLAPATLIGNCVGGAMSLNFTLQNPSKIRRLVLFNMCSEKILLAGPLADVYRNFSHDAAAREAFVDAIEQNGMPREQTDQGLQMQLGATHVGDDPEFAEHIYRLYNQRGQMRTLYNNLSQFATFRVLDEFSKPRASPLFCCSGAPSTRCCPRRPAKCYLGDQKKMWTLDHLRRCPELQSPNVLLNQMTPEERAAFHANYIRGGPAGRFAPADS